VVEADGEDIPLLVLVDDMELNRGSSVNSDDDVWSFLDWRKVRARARLRTRVEKTLLLLLVVAVNASG